MLPCLNKSLFGVDCTGCGAQRSVAFLLKGEFVNAFYMYPAIYTIMLLAGFLVADIFFKFKYSYTIKIGLILVNAVIIVFSYLIKMYHLIN